MKKILLLLCFLSYYSATQAQIIFNEIEADAGNNEGSGGEWIELKNIGTTTVDLSCWKITNGGSYILTIPSGLQLNAGQYLLIGNSSKMMCATCDFPNLAGQFTLNTSGYGIGSGNYANTILLNTDLSANGGCNCMNGTGALANGSLVGDRIVMFNSTGTIQDAFMYSNGSNYGTDSLLVNFPNIGACTPLANAVVPATNNSVFVGKTVCNDLASCNSSYARLPDGNNILPIAYSQQGNFNCTDCTEPCGASADIAGEDHPTPGLANNTLSWEANLNGTPVISQLTNTTVCGATALTFEYKIYNHQGVALQATQASGNLGSFVKVGSANPTNFGTTNINASTGTTTLTATLNPAIGNNTYDLVWANANTICGTCPGTNNPLGTADISNVNSECYIYRGINVFREEPLSGTPNVSCTIPGSATVSGVTGTNITYTLEKQSTVGGAFVPVGTSQSSNLFGNILDDDADPVLPNYRISISTNNTVCPNSSTLIVLVPNACLGNPVCPTYDTTGSGVPQFLPASGSTVCAASPVNFSVSINGVCTNGVVEVIYDTNPAFDPYTQGTSLGTFGTTVGTTPPTTVSTNKVFINEFMPGAPLGSCISPIVPDGASPNSGEWIELYNAGSSSADISGWAISDGDWTATIPAGTLLASNSFYLIGGGGTFCSSGQLPDLNIETCNCAITRSGQDIMNLRNGGEQIALFDCSGNVLDYLGWGSGSFSNISDSINALEGDTSIAAGCGNYIAQKMVGVGAATRVGVGNNTTGQSFSRTNTNTWVKIVGGTPKAANATSYNGSAIPFGTQCPAPPVSSNFAFNLPDTCSLTAATNITIKAIYKPTPLSPCTESAVTAIANYTIPSCIQFTLSGSGEYCEPNTAPISISTSEPLIGGYDIFLSNGSTNAAIFAATGNGPFTTNLPETGSWTIAAITSPAGVCSPKKEGNADINIYPIPTITASPSSVNACFQNNFDLSTINTQLTSTPFATNYAWYDVPSGGSPLPSTLISPQSTGNYYVSPVNGLSSFCEGTRIPVLINVDPTPTDPTILSCTNLGLVLLPQNPNCLPTTCSNVEYSANGIDWSSALNYTAADPGWNNWGSPTNSGMYIRNTSSPACLNFYYYINPCSFPLPASLISFDARVNEQNMVDIRWEAADEHQVSHYEIERSNSQFNFVKIGEHQAKNANVPNAYSILDKMPYSGNNYYRLKIQDLDGKISYSPIEKVFINTHKSIITSLYPNPSNENLNIELSAMLAEKVTIQVFDMLGKLVFSQKVQLKNGTSTHTLNLQGLAAGNYLIRIPFTQGVDVKQFVKE